MPERIDILRKELAAANARTQAAIDSGDFDKQSASSEIAQTVATELNSLFLQVDPYELRVANAVWVTQRWPLKKSYTDVIHDNYGGSVFPIDFRDQEGACRRINAWVERETDGHIRDLVRPDPADEPIGLVLTNSVYFRGEWLNPFPRNGQRRRRLSQQLARRFESR